MRRSSSPRLGLLRAGEWWVPGLARPEARPHASRFRREPTLGQASADPRLCTARFRWPWAGHWHYLARLFGSSDPIQAGEFEIPKGASGSAVLDLLQHGRPVQRLDHGNRRDALDHRRGEARGERVPDRCSTADRRRARSCPTATDIERGEEPRGRGPADAGGDDQDARPAHSEEQRQVPGQPRGRRS